MTEYTADDFKRARFATHGSGATMERKMPGDAAPWMGETRVYRNTDAEMADAGWVPVREPGDLADGGVTCAAIEKEAGEDWQDAGEVGNAPHWRARAEKAERALFDQQTNARCWMKTSESWQVTAEEWEARATRAEENVRAREEIVNRLSARAEKAEQEIERLGLKLDEAHKGRHSANRLRQKAEQERDDAQRSRDRWRLRAEAAELTARDLRAGQSRPVEVTDEMVERGYDVLTTTTKIGVPFVRELLAAALTEPPARDPRAEALHEAITDWKTSQDGETDTWDLAEWLVETGWTKEER